MDGAVDATAAPAPGLDNRLWIDERRFKTGGMGFSLYQWRTEAATWCSPPPSRCMASSKQASASSNAATCAWPS